MTAPVVLPGTGTHKTEPQRVDIVTASTSLRLRGGGQMFGSVLTQLRVQKGPLAVIDTNAATSRPTAPVTLPRGGLAPGDALLIIDVQNDFLPGGQLAVPHGDEVIEPLNHYIDRFTERNLPIVLTRDWHPKNHCSFTTQGGPWPVHCVQFSYGAEIADELNVPASAIVFCKPGIADRETYTPFIDATFAPLLRSRGVSTVFVGGLATDYCVLHSSLDALENGFHVYLLTDAIRAVNVRPDDGAKALETMYSRGALPFAFDLISRS